MGEDKGESVLNQNIFWTKMALGGFACMTAGTVTHPVDFIKTRMQANYKNVGIGFENSSFSTFKKIVNKEGVRSLYKGLTATWVREGVYSSLRLGLYEPFKQLFGATDRAHTPLYIMVLSGAMSGMIGSALSNPADLLKIRMMTWEKQPHSIVWHARDVYSHNGTLGFYRGVQATISRAIALNATQLPTYDFLKHKLINLGVLQDNHVCHLVCSITAGIVVTCVTSPFDLARTRLMNQPVNQKIYSGMFDCLQKSVRREGIMSLYKGFTPQWLRLGPFTIIQLTVWEGLRSSFGIKTI